MKVYKKVGISFVIAFVIFMLSLYGKFIPCQTAPAVPNPQYYWTFCDLNPDQSQVGIVNQYFSYSPNLRETYIILLLLVFIISY